MQGTDTIANPAGVGSDGKPEHELVKYSEWDKLGREHFYRNGQKPKPGYKQFERKSHYLSNHLNEFGESFNFMKKNMEQLTFTKSMQASQDNN